MGPLVSGEHRDKVEKYIREGINEGAKLVLGGKRPSGPPGSGYYVIPTIFTEVTQNMTIARDEIFGPVACVLKFSSEDEVLELANDSVFGLAASVFTRDTTKAIKFANALKVGYVWIL
jgi:acyl-CoA reductase-like NAD-dependent aldehyde dehydrogenase